MMDPHTRYQYQHHAGVRELDLSACHPSTFADKINHAVPGLKSSTAFFGFLRANLVLSPSAMSSCANTPLLDPITAPATYSYSSLSTSSFSSTSSQASSSSSISPSSSSSASRGHLVPLDDIPPLSLEALDTPDEKAQGLDLVTESVAQMRPRAAAALATHPICLAGYSLGLIAALKVTGEDHPGAALALAAALTAACWFVVRRLAGGYDGVAGEMSWPWLRNPATSEEDIIIGARYDGDSQVVGALVLRIEPNPTTKRRGSGGRNQRGGRGIIRAWTTKERYRDQGIGRDLLEKAVRTTRERCGRDAEIGFAQQHANSVMLLPSIFNGRFRRDEIRATKALDNAIARCEVTKRKR